MRTLTAKQEKFCINYLLTNNATEAAIKAGYSKDTAVVIASNNLTKVNIKNRLIELRDKTESAKIMGVRERREMLTLIARFGGKLSIPAIAELNKMGGDYAPTRQDITSKGNEIKSSRIYNIINPETKLLLEKLENVGRLEPNTDIRSEPKQLSEPVIQTITQ
jgi:phage terminase small subunit